MVRIINGEIVQDNDPRLQARQRPTTNRPEQGQQQHVGFTGSAAGQPQAAAQQAAAAGGFDWSAPPFRALPNEYGSMLPDVELYGLRVPGVGLVAVAALGMFFGWRGLLGGLIFGYLYLTYGQGAVAAARQGRPAGRPGAAAAAAAGGGGGFMQQALGGLMGGDGTAADGLGRSAAGAAAAQPAGLRQGKGRKLGSN